MSHRQEYERIYVAFIIFGVIILMGNIYYFSHPLLRSVGFTIEAIDYLILSFRKAGMLDTPYRTKLAALAVLLPCCLVRSGKGVKVEPAVIAGIGAVSLALYLLPTGNSLSYLLCTVTGFVGMTWTFATLGRLFARFNEHDNNIEESFRQEDRPVTNEYSIVLETKYYHNKKYHKGYISVINPFRGTLIVGSAGSGKSFSVFNPYIDQMIGHGYTMMLYDFKMPDLSKVVYNALLRHADKYAVKPSFYCIDFKDPERSNRCNPIAPEYLTDLSDANETARVVMEALNKGNEKRDFFWMSAEQYIGICLWYLRIYTPKDGFMGDWCDFPHLIELVSQDYSKVLKMVKNERSLDSKARVFVDAMEANAQDQLQGQIASARIPLNNIASPALYWVLSGNDFSLDINDPEEPKILCIGNDPDRQKIYGTALSLFTFRVIKRVNRPGKLPCGIIMDELPTISVDGLDNLMATARQNKVAVVLGVQDTSQIVADYGEKVAEKIIALPANVFVGSCSLKTAEKYSKEFGKEFRRQESQTQSIDSESVNISFHEEEIMPIRKITSLPQGTFIGKVAVDQGTPIGQPFFCGAIQVDMKEYRRRKRREKELPRQYVFHNDDDLLRILKSPGMIEDLSRRLVRERIERTWRKKHLEFSRQDLEKETQKQFGSMNTRRKGRLIDECLPQLKQEDISNRIERNYNQIKTDIANMMGEAEREGGGSGRPLEKAPVKDDLEPDEDPGMVDCPAGDIVDEFEGEASIDTLNIDEKCRSVLQQAGVRTLADLTLMTKDELIAVKGIGLYLADEIERMLIDKGMYFATDSIGNKNTQ